MSVLDEIKFPIEQEYLYFKTFFKDLMKSDKKLLTFVLNYILKNKGKELRPILVLLCAKLVGKINEKTYVAASLVELLHTATLVHDDVVDNSQIRRNSFSIKALWKSKLAVLVGDYLLAQGLLISVRYKAFDVLEIVSDAVQDMAKGELIQIEKVRRLNITEDEYFDIISKKTASLLIASSLSGAKSVTDNEEILADIRKFGYNLGMAFQIKDDLFDYQQTYLVGKPYGNDIQESKITLPLIYSLKNSQKDEQRKIRKILAKKTKTNDDIKFVHNFVKIKGGIEYSENVLLQFVKTAKNILNSNFSNSDTKKSLDLLVDFVIFRKK